MALVERIGLLCKDVEERLIIICLDNKFLLNKVTSVDKKASACADDCRVIHSRIDKTLENVPVEVVFECSNDKIRRGEEFKDNRGGFLVRYCDKKSKER